VNGIQQHKRRTEDKGTAGGIEAEADRQEARSAGRAFCSDVTGQPACKRHGGGEGRDKSDNFGLHRSGSFAM
jgi:hypothetical protein